uniref:MICOS complex subunit MIC60 n=1 Tax=Tetraselmis sp. GSL018 TaxID=582737 RepID=A0A061RJI6_9CHLO
MAAAGAGYYYYVQENLSRGHTTEELEAPTGPRLTDEPSPEWQTLSDGCTEGDPVAAAVDPVEQLGSGGEEAEESGGAYYTPLVPPSGTVSEVEGQSGPSESGPGDAEEDSGSEESLRVADEEENKQAAAVLDLINEALVGEPAADPQAADTVPEGPASRAADAALAAKAVAADVSGDELFSRLGVDSKRLDTVGLVWAAIDGGAGSDPKGFQAAHRQAASDAEVFKGVLAEVLEKQDAAFASYRGDVESARQDLEAARAAAEKERKALLERQAAELQQQQERSATASAQAIKSEREARAKVLGGLGEQVGVLREALGMKHQEVQRMCGTHRLAAAAFSLQQALDSGRPFADELRDLRDSAPGDSLVEAIADSLESSSASMKSGIPTRDELIDRFDRVAATAGSLVLLPETGGGLLATLLSHSAGLLRMRETSGERLGLEGGGFAAASARAKSKLAAGQLLAAAEELQRAADGSAAAAVVADWAAALRARAAAEQALVAIQAHATAIAVSFSG